MPNVVMEALASGLPVVATDVGEVPFMIQDGENGCVVEAEAQSYRLANAVVLALEREWDRERIRRESGSRTWKDAAEKVLGAILSVD